jgi:hypothetical protein
LLVIGYFLLGYDGGMKVQFSLSWLMGLVAACAAIAGLARAVPTATPALLVFAWLAAMARGALLDAPGEPGDGSQLFSAAKPFLVLSISIMMVISLFAAVAMFIHGR